MSTISLVFVKKVLLIIFFMFLPQGKPAVVVVFFGDSITAGYGLATVQAFPALVEKTLNGQEKRIKAVNAGLSGETSAGGRNRIDWVLKRQPFDIFVLELGANDALRGLPIEQIANNLQTIIDKVKAKNANAKIVLAGMMAPPNLGKEYTTQFQHIYPALAKKNKATLIPFLLEGVGGNPALNLPDGIHPNIEGHKVLAATVSKTIASILPPHNE